MLILCYYDISEVLGSVIIASDRSGSGKTIITSGIMKALSRSHKIVPFKVGPDYIDPGYHQLASGELSVNLDLWMMNQDELRTTFNEYSSMGDIGIIEGTMGVYDGITEGYSTYNVAEILKASIVLTIDCKNVGETAGYVVRGLLERDHSNLIKGVILNRISSKRHYDLCRSHIPQSVRVIGYIPYEGNLSIPSRHLGLLTKEENREAEQVIRTASELISKYVDIEALTSILTRPNMEKYPKAQGEENVGKPTAAVAYDSAFLFYYRKNLDLLRKYYNIRFFSPLRDETVSDPSLIYVGGGYPELFATKLERAASSRSWIKSSAGKGVTILAECGGLMYLGKSIKTQQGRYKMANVFDVGTTITNKLTLSYTELEAEKETPLVKMGSKIRGHEFHYSKPEFLNETPVMRNLRGQGIMDRKDGLLYERTLATYSHFFFSPQITRDISLV